MCIRKGEKTKRNLGKTVILRSLTKKCLKKKLWKCLLFFFFPVNQETQIFPKHVPNFSKTMKNKWKKIKEHYNTNAKVYATLIPKSTGQRKIRWISYPNQQNISISIACLKYFCLHKILNAFNFSIKELQNFLKCYTTCNSI